MAVDQQIADAYWRQVANATKRPAKDNSYMWIYPCNTTLPPLTFAVAGSSVTIPGESFKRGWSVGDSNGCEHCL